MEKHTQRSYWTIIPWCILNRTISRSSYRGWWRFSYYIRIWTQTRQPDLRKWGKFNHKLMNLIRRKQTKTKKSERLVSVFSPPKRSAFFFNQTDKTGRNGSLIFIFRSFKESPLAHGKAYSRIINSDLPAGIITYADDTKCYIEEKGLHLAAKRMREVCMGTRMKFNLSKSKVIVHEGVALTYSYSYS